MRLGALVALVALAGCGGKKDEPGANPPPRVDARTLTCKHAPECVPAIATPDRTCETRDFAFTCTRCSDDGALLECRDIDEDGCFELLRTECGRPNLCEVGKEEAACKKLPDVSLNLFGAETPAGFVACDKGNVFTVTGDKIVAVVRTRGMFVAPATWSVGIKGATPEPAMIPADYVDVDDTHGVLRQELAVGNATEVELVYTVKDRFNQIALTCGPVKLQR